MERGKKNRLRTYLLALLLIFAFTAAPGAAKEAKAATAGFKTVKGKTYYIRKNGSKQKGWLTLKGKKYYFNPTTGVQLKGWQTDAKGNKIRYFTKGSGAMVKGWLSDSKGNKRYFRQKNGVMVKGWLTLNGKKYYFTSGSGVMVKGWLSDSKGRRRYFNEKTGQMTVGLYKKSKNEVYYFDRSTGYMQTGLRKISGKYYYFSPQTGKRCQSGFTTVGSNRYYFARKDGHALTGWFTSGGKKYYFSGKGVMYVNTTAKIGGKTYRFGADGAVETGSGGTVSGGSRTFAFYDEKNQRSYPLMNEYKTHPGIADKSKSDLDLLAAFCEAEAGDQGQAGMEAVVLCVLNRTIKADKEFPSNVRQVIYHGSEKFAQYSVVTDGALVKRLNGQFYNRELAYKAAQTAMNTFQKYLTDKTPRKIAGIKSKDFKYMYFMMESYFWNQPLNFDKVTKLKYKDHMFFVDWV